MRRAGGDIPPERLIKATLSQALSSIRSERQLCEQIFRWFLDLKPDDPVFDPTPFTKNRDRFAEHGFMERFFNGTVAQALCEEQEAQQSDAPIQSGPRGSSSTQRQGTAARVRSGGAGREVLVGPGKARGAPAMRAL